MESGGVGREVSSKISFSSEAEAMYQRQSLKEFTLHYSTGFKRLLFTYSL